MPIEFFKKIIKFIKNMITEDSIAAAQMAQIFGSELLKVQQSVSDSTSQPEIVKLNPKQFLVGQQNFNQHRKLEEQQLIAKINREAEMLHPLPQSFSQPPPVHSHQQVQPISAPPIVHGPTQNQLPLTQQHSDVLHLIASFLERIANKLDLIDIKPKRKIVKRKPKNTKKILLNENNV